MLESPPPLGIEDAELACLAVAVVERDDKLVFAVEHVRERGRPRGALVPHEHVAHDVREPAEQSQDCGLVSGDDLDVVENDAGADPHHLFDARALPLEVFVHPERVAETVGILVRHVAAEVVFVLRPRHILVAKDAETEVVGRRGEAGVHAAVRQRAHPFQRVGVVDVVWLEVHFVVGSFFGVQYAPPSAS
jgi:hypothetical protein